jgi:hypothetical protein
VPGSGGDIIQQVLGYSGCFENQYTNTVRNDGRAMLPPDKCLVELFPKNTGGWYNRTWSEGDITALKKLMVNSSRPWIIGTHKLEQVKFLKESLDITTIGITYNKGLYPAVIKNWCKKSSIDSVENREIYKDSKIAQTFKEKGLYAEFMLKETLTHFNNIPKEVDNDFDINIKLGDMYNNNLFAISNWLTESGLLLFAKWVSLQDPLYKVSYTHPPSYMDIVGYNQQATTVCNDPIKLSSLDQILMLHYYKKLPSNITTNIDFINFLNTQE